MTKCVYCACTADINPGKDYCEHCGHDAVAHVAASTSAGSATGLKLLIVAGAALAAYFFLNSQPDVVSGLPGSGGMQTPPISEAPSNAAPTTASSPGAVYTLPPPTVQPNGQVLPAAPPLGDWRSNPGAAAPDSAAPNPAR